ncbi:hypothetical protein YC2023_086370 [Brassica napus]
MVRLHWTYSKLNNLLVSPKISRLLRGVKEKLLCGSAMTTPWRYLSKKPSSIEKRISLMGLTSLSKTRHCSQNSSDSRSVILVVAILIVTATYQAGLSPPGGVWQENSPELKDHSGQIAGKMIMPFYVAVYFYVHSGIAFFSALYVIMILIVGLPMWKTTPPRTSFGASSSLRTQRLQYPQFLLRWWNSLSISDAGTEWAFHLSTFAHLISYRDAASSVKKSVLLSGYQIYFPSFDFCQMAVRYFGADPPANDITQNKNSISEVDMTVLDKPPQEIVHLIDDDANEDKNNNRDDQHCDPTKVLWFYELPSLKDNTQLLH